MMDEVEQLKQGHRAMWSAGDYEAIAAPLRTAGALLVSRTGIGPGDDVLDVACGTGNATIAAAQTGARVVGADLTPALLEQAAARAAELGVAVDLVEADAEALPFADASFDVVLSTFGCMFAPRHEIVAREIARVLRPAGQVGFCSWTPEGAIGDFFRTVAMHVPPPPPFVSPPLLWGTEVHLERLFAGTGLTFAYDRAIVDFRFDSIPATVETYEREFGPIMMARELLEPQGLWQALRDDLGDMFNRNNVASNGAAHIPAEYLLAHGRRRA
jgi:SAM-dependent methyltransferase